MSTRTTVWGYDALSRLTGETISNATPAGVVGYEFDKVGNRQVRTSTIPVIPGHVTGHTPNDWLTSETYDANGNTLVSAAGTDVYDADNRLVQRTRLDGSVVRIGYDGDGTKVWEEVGGMRTTFLVSGINPTGYSQTLEEWQGSTLTKVYVWGQGLAPLSQRSGAGVATVHYPVTDGQGSVRGLTTSTGALSDQYAYDAYGILLAKTGSTPNRYLYCGYEFCEPLGQYYLRARYYDQGRGRFPTADRWEGRERTPLTQNKYLYANASAVNLIDPSGYFGLAEVMGGIAISMNFRNSVNSVTITTGFALIATIEGINDRKSADEIAIGFLTDQFVEGQFCRQFYRHTAFIVIL